MCWIDFLEIATWLTTKYQAKDGGIIRFIDIYTKAVEFFVPPHLTPSKKIVSRMIASLFPESKCTVVYTNCNNYSCYTGLVERCTISTDDTSVFIPNECEAGKDSLGQLMITCPTLDVVNGEIVKCTMTFGKTTCLMIRGTSLQIHQQIDLTQSNVDGLVYLCENVKLCKGIRYDKKFPVSKYAVIEDWSRFCNKNQTDQRVRSTACKIILPWTSKVEYCSACRNILRCKKKRKAEDHDDDCIVHDMEANEENMITPVETPSLKLEPDGMVAQAPDVMLTANVDTEADKLIKVLTFNGAPEKRNILLESQLRNNKKDNTVKACPEKVSSKYRRYSQTATLNVYKAVKEQKMPSYSTASKFKVPETTLRQKVSAEVSVEAVSPGPPPLLSREEEAIFVERLKLMLNTGNKCTRAEFLRLATEYAVSLHKKDREHPFSLKWFKGFIRRWPGLDFISKPGSDYKKMIKTSVKTKNAVSEKTYRDIDHILRKYNLLDKPHHIYNFGHKVLQTEHVSLDASSCRTCTSIPATSSSSAVATVICCGNALGTMIPPYFIFQGYRMKKDFLSGCSTGAGGDVTENGLLNDHVFQNYLKKHFLSYVHSRDSGQTILLLYSGHKLDISSSVIKWAIEQYKVIMYLLPAQTVQPLDHDCFGPFQQMYNTECHEFLHRFPSVKITTMNVGTMACKAYLHAFSPINLQSSFRKAGIYPFYLSAFDAPPTNSEESSQSYDESDKRNEENEGNSDSEPYSKARDELTNTQAQKCHKRQNEKKAKKLRDSAIITKSGDRIISDISEIKTETV